MGRGEQADHHIPTYRTGTEKNRLRGAGVAELAEGHTGQCTNSREAAPA